MKLCARNKVRSEERKMRYEEKKQDLNALCSEKSKKWKFMKEGG
jgi:hypothetical protein